MKHILFFIESLSGGGAEKVLVTLLKHLDYSKYEVTLMPLVDTGVLRDDLDKTTLHYTPVLHEGKTSWQRIRNKIKYKLIYYYLPCKFVNRWIIPQKGIDLYIAFTEGFSTKLLSYTPKKKIAWVHADLKTDPWTLNSHIYKNLLEEQQAYNRFDKVVCVSKSVEQVMKEHYGLNQTMTIYNPIDTEDIFQKAKQTIEIEIPSSFNIVSVGRLVSQKGYDQLIPIIGRLRHEGKDVQLYIIGEGGERKLLESVINEEGLQNYVHLMGFLKNPYSLMSKMDLFVCSSRAEGYSLVIAEAMVLGLPVISTDCAGPNELLENDKSGALCDTYYQLEERIEEAIDNKDYISQLKEKTKKRKVFYGISRTMTQVDSLLYEDFI